MIAPDGPVDMTPVLLLCAANNGLTTIFTFHSDGVLRQWYGPSLFVMPEAVQEFATLQDLPPKDDWSDEPIRMMAYVYCHQDDYDG